MEMEDVRRLMADGRSLRPDDRQGRDTTMCGDPKSWFPMRVTYQREMKVKAELDRLGIENFVPLRYMMDRTAAQEYAIMTVADREMENFMRVASRTDDSVTFLDNETVVGKEGKRGDSVGAGGDAEGDWVIDVHGTSGSWQLWFTVNGSRLIVKGS